MHHKIFFQKLRLGPHVLKNRIVHPSLTCMGHPLPGNVLDEIMTRYYEQRSGAGMIVSEAIHVGQSGHEQCLMTGVTLSNQIERWRHIISAVHSKGAAIFAQLTHTGYFPRMIISSGHTRPALPVAGNVSPQEKDRTISDRHEPQTALFLSGPGKLTSGDIETITTEFADAARAALDAGFDGVEIQAGNNHLVHQFLSEQSNDRYDMYGGTLERRLTFLEKVIKAVTGRIGAEHTGVCITPSFNAPEKTGRNGLLTERNPHETYLEAIEILEADSVAYLSISETDGSGIEDLPPSFRDDIRRIFSGRIISSGNYTTERAEQILASGWSDLVGFGQPFLVNPDLPERIASGWPLASRSSDILHRTFSAGRYG